MTPERVTARVTAARRLAEELLAPAAEQVERDGRIPRSHLDALAAAGLYGVDDDALAVVEELAAGDLATTFVWVQHLVVVRIVSGAGHAWLPMLADLRAGRLRAGVAMQAALRPGPPAVVARRDSSGGSTDADTWVLDGAVPWVTGWGLVDMVLVAARDGDDVRFLLVDADPATAAPTLRAEPQPLVAVRASSTVELNLTGHRVPADRLVTTAAHAELLAHDAAGLRPNGSLALGLVLRCTRAIGPSPLDGELATVRAHLDSAGPDDLPAARATAAGLAWRAAGALSAASGSRSVLAGSLAERTAREALFLLVFASRPSIRDALLADLGASGPSGVPERVGLRH